MPASKKRTKTGLVGAALVNLCAGVNLGALALLWAVVACQWVSPAVVSWCGVACLTLPFLVFLNLLFIPFWLIVRYRYTLIPLVGIGLCSSVLYGYCPFLNGSDEEATLKVITYNTHGWGAHSVGCTDTTSIVRWLIDSHADILVLNEVNTLKKNVEPLEAAGYTHMRPSDSRSTNSVYTRLPALECGTVGITTKSTNGAMYARMLLGSDTLTVVAVHLESFDISPDDRDSYVEVMKNPTSDGTKGRSHALVEHIRPVFARRAKQAVEVRDFVRDELERGHHVILAGDFNDVPNSYAVHTIREELTDCYRAAGNGVGFTFHESLMYFRIDHILCSPSLHPLRTWVDKTIGRSDHYPVVSELAL
ncbi:MAG: endonuclease/exonuclease/phosphatase family protein [Bacteroidaceae bacterium]|nr:endonuclease/exonuclease/phosphatase family protein [Bacteroidaceae bacterium]MCF0195302.1 endonuclease/exonuclease/phosphatase family protein [Bacteroidaceae bacterium]